ncbi:unnamed protein product, partial [Medioppia subpectinata]
GIPYATPPVGDLRFRPTVPISYAQNITINATNFGNTCPQTGYTLPDNEDCLYLNIWTPTLNTSAKLPVMFWIYPGGFYNGSADQYDGRDFAIRGVVYVSMNFRLGALGYLCTNRPDAAGNMGELDQRMALKWTQQYIGHFGGNGNDITLFGQSSGSISVSAHMLSNASNVYFKKAILQSGTITTSIFGSKSANTMLAKKFATFAGCNPHTNYVQCLRRKSVAEIVSAQNNAYLWNNKNTIGIQFVSYKPFGICYDSEYLPHNPIELLRRRNFRSNLKVITGHTIIEGAFLSPLLNVVIPEWGQYYPNVTVAPIDKQVAYDNLCTLFANTPYVQQLTHKYTQTFSNRYNDSQSSGLRAAVVQAFSDYAYTCPTILFGQYLVQYSNFSVNLHQYYLKYANSQSDCYNSTWCYGAKHTDDLPLVFGQPFYEPNYTDTDRYMSALVMDIWTTFAKTGTLPKVNDKRWLPYTPLPNGGGIPYATPPVGDLRFRPTVPIRYTQNKTIMTTKYRNDCPQNGNSLDKYEDCLYLNIWTPTLNTSARLPVMVMISPGGFLVSLTTTIMGQLLAIRHVVYVQMNFRLGALGYLCTDRPDAAGNMGELDQSMALKWTHRYIRHFGGNGNDITLFGESSGSISVSAHILYNASNIYFKKTILQSGSIFSNDVGSVADNTQVAKRFAQFMGCNPNKNYVQCLRGKSVAEIVSAQNNVQLWNKGNQTAIQVIAYKHPFGICYGSDYLPHSPIELLRRRNFRQDLQVLSGHLIIEGALISPDFGYVIPWWGQYDPTVATVPIDKQLTQGDILTIYANAPFANRLAQKYTQGFSDRFNDSQTQSLRAAVVQVLSDYRYSCPTVLFGQYLVQYSNFAVNLHQYYLTYANSQSYCYNSTWCYGAKHFDDVPLVFGQPFYEPNYTDTDRYMSALMMNIWTDFAKTG